MQIMEAEVARLSNEKREREARRRKLEAEARAAGRTTSPPPGMNPFPGRSR